jgi:hypothetical protein
MVERRLIALLLSGFFLMSVLPFSPSVSFDPLQMGDDDEGQALSEEQIVALESLPAFVKVSGRNGNSTMETWQWAVKAGSDSGSDFGRKIALDSYNDAHIVGIFERTVTFGDISLTSDGDADIFIAKLSSSGIWQWAVRAGGSDKDHGSEIAFDSNDNIFCTGVFRGTATFGDTILEIDSGFEPFIAKLSSNGSWLWAAAGEGGSGNTIDGLIVDSIGNAYITGHFSRTTTFDNLSLTSIDRDMFIAKISSIGSWQWAVKVDGSGEDYSRGKAMAVDSNDNIYLTGIFAETAIFGNITLTSRGDYDIFVAKISSSGSWQWIVEAGGVSEDIGVGIAVDSTGNIYVSGKISETTTFGSTNLTSNGDTDIFIAKLNNSGSWQWAVNVGDSEGDSGHDIVVDSTGNAYVVGVFKLTATFGSISLEGDITKEIFIAKISSSGLWEWALKADTSDHSSGLGIALDEKCNVYVTGHFKGTATFGNTSFTSYPLDYPDLFVAKFSGLDADCDGVQDSLDNCVDDANADQTDYDSDNIGDVCDTDTDGDNVLNVDDMCPMGMNTWVSSSTNDHDGDGCNDYEDLDDDNDGICDIGGPAFYCRESSAQDDMCHFSPLGFISTLSTDFDGDGCEDDTEDDDDDGDGFSDLEDKCKFQAGSADQGGHIGCPDSDGDGWADIEEVFPNDPTQWSDVDEDGYGNSPLGTTPDGCITIRGNSTVDRYGCIDSDGDGYSNPDSDWTVFEGADAFSYDDSQWFDTDGDGFGDNPLGTDADDCVDEFGNSTIDRLGCLDSDGDGYSDLNDAFINEPTQWSDQDGDGFGDNEGSVNGDSCLTQYGTSSIGDKGCLDSDSDGTSDENDFYPQDPTRSVKEELYDHRWFWASFIAPVVIIAAIPVFFMIRKGGKYPNLNQNRTNDINAALQPQLGLPIPPEGLPPGWTMEQWNWYGEDWLRLQDRL